jgi:hypothetical protein
MSGNIKENVTRRSIWLRLVYMAIFGVALSVVEFVTFAVVAFQFLASLFTGQPNDQLIRFGRNLARYIQQIIVFMTFATEEKPFPFTPWPDEPHEQAPMRESRNQLNDSVENAGGAEGDADEGEEKMADTDNPKDADMPTG